MKFKQILASLFNLFIFTAAHLIGQPVITNLSPYFGPATGGTVVTIQGSGFSTTMHVNFGSTPASFVVVNDSQISVTSPSDIPRTVNVSVTDPSGTSSNVHQSQFTYQGDLFAYATTTSSGSGGVISVINLSTNQQESTISTHGNELLGIVITPDRTKAYFGDGSNDTLTQINLINNTTSLVINLASTPFGIAISPDSKTVYVCLLHINQVVAIDIQTTISTMIPTNSPFDLALTPDGTQAYVTNLFANTISLINLASGQTVDTIPFANPTSIAITPNGETLYVIDDTNHFVTSIDTASRVAHTITLSDPPTNLSVAPNGHIYTTSYSFDSASKVDLIKKEEVSLVGVSMNPNAIVISPDGRTAYVTNHNDPTITTIDIATNTVTTSIPIPCNADSLAITPDQAPYASFTFKAAGPGYQSIFDASKSVSPVGEIVSYKWNFDDGSIRVTSSPIITHDYHLVGNFNVVLTVTNSVGTSNTQTFTGHTVSNQGGPNACMNQIVSNELLPPSNFRGKRQSRTFLTQADHVYKLTWSPSPDPRVIEYVLLRNGREFQSVPASGPFVYKDHYRRKNKPDVYTIYAVGDEGFQSQRLSVRVK